MWDHDYAFPIFDENFRPILPKLVKSSDNKRHVEQGKSDLEALADFLESRIIKKKWCRGAKMLCYYEQLEYILSYNYNGVKMLVPNGRHKIPMMFFPAHGKHLNIPWSAVE